MTKKPVVQTREARYGQVKLTTTKYLVVSSVGLTAISKVQNMVGNTLVEGVATEIIIRDDRGGSGCIEVFITKPAGVKA
jgi:hypothetical protein